MCDKTSDIQGKEDRLSKLVFVNRSKVTEQTYVTLSFLVYVWLNVYFYVYVVRNVLTHITIENVLPP